MMSTIILYVMIMLVGVLLAKKKLIPEAVKEKLLHLQKAALIFLLSVLGYKLGSDSRLLSSIHLLGVQSFVIAVSSMIFTIVFVFIVFKKGDR